MTQLRLYIGNKNYSSWSLRAWLGLRAKNIAFEEVLKPFSPTGANPTFREFSPSGLVPVLVDGALVVWESLAILEYVAEKFPDRGVWPAALPARARARSIAHEMHAGFAALRKSCPMNIRRPTRPIAVSDDVKKDVARVEQIWKTSLEASGGPFLFGEFTAADAMYAPVVNRFTTYGLSAEPFVQRYAEAVMKLDAWKEWAAASGEEPWTIAHEEV